MPNRLDYNLLFDSMPISRFVVSVEGEKYILCIMNSRAEEHFGKNRKDIEGHDIADLLDSENTEHLVHSLNVCAKRKKPVMIKSLPSFPGNEQVPGFWINPIFNENGDVFLFDVLAQPVIPDDSALQRERDDALSLLTSIFDVSEVGILVTDRFRRIIKVNDSFVRIYGWSRQDLVGTDFLQVVSQEERDQVEMSHEEFINGGIRSSGEMKLIRKNGSNANVLFTTATLELSQKRRFQVTTIMDITLRKQMEFSLRVAKEQADTANHAKSAFLANMSHELRTPLNAIIGFSEMILKETFGPLGHEKYYEYLGDIHMSARHLLEIINEVLDMSKIEAGKVELDEQQIDVTGLIESVVRIMANRAFGSGIKIRETIEKNIPVLFADPRLVRQILINLVTNAVKYSQEKSFIDVGAYIGENGDLHLSVEDHGVGIPKHRIKEAMEPFGQIHDPTRTNTQQGTGLGLPLSKAMAELHGGYLTIESDTGKGTLVTVVFPASRVQTVEKGDRGSAFLDHPVEKMGSE